MGCGCAKKMAAIKARKNKRKANKSGGKIVRKKRVSKNLYQKVVILM